MTNWKKKIKKELLWERKKFFKTISIEKISQKITKALNDAFSIIYDVAYYYDSYYLDNFESDLEYPQICSQDIPNQIKTEVLDEIKRSHNDSAILKEVALAYLTRGVFIDNGNGTVSFQHSSDEDVIMALKYVRRQLRHHNEIAMTIIDKDLINPEFCRQLPDGVFW